MSLDLLLNPTPGIDKALIQANDANNLFRDATWDSISRDEELRGFLRRTLAGGSPSAKEPQENLEALVVAEAERIRGGWPWVEHGIPAVYPTSLSEHQYFNLIERLYLSRDYQSGKAAIFVHGMPTQKEFQSKKTSILTGVSIVSIGIGAIAWSLRRRVVASKNGGFN